MSWLIGLGAEVEVEARWVGQKAWLSLLLLPLCALFKPLSSPLKVEVNTTFLQLSTFLFCLEAYYIAQTLNVGIGVEM